MIIEVDNSFNKDFKKIKNIELEKRIIEKIENIYDISNIKIMRWFSKGVCKNLCK